MAGNPRGTMPAVSLGMPGEEGRPKEDRSRGFGGGGLSLTEYRRKHDEDVNAQVAARIGLPHSAVFNGCVVHVDGHTGVGKDELAELVIRNGGRYSPKVEPEITHFVVNSLPIGKVCMCVYLSIYRHLSISIYLSIDIYLHLLCLSIYLSSYIYSYIYPYIHPSVCFHLSIYPSI